MSGNVAGYRTCHTRRKKVEGNPRIAALDKPTRHNPSANRKKNLMM
jgi:hypothetical protein